MRRPSVIAIVFIGALYASAAMLGASGVLDAAGSEVTIQEEQNFLQRIGQVDPEIGGGIPIIGTVIQSIVGIVISVAEILGTVLNAVNYAPVVFASLGVPQFITQFLMLLSGFVIGIDLIYILTGRRL